MTSLKDPSRPARDPVWPLFFMLGGAAAYTAYSAIYEVGIVGWLNHAQQALFGGYLNRLSGLLCFAVVCIGLGHVLDRTLVWWASKRPAAPMPCTECLPEPAPISTLAVWGGMWILLMAVIWGIGLACWGWQAWQDRSDEQARFVATDADAPPPAGSNGYLALAGRLRPDLALQHQVGSSTAHRTDHLIVPVTATPDGPTPQRPVRYVVRVQPGLALRTPAGTPLHVRDEAPLPVPVAQAFALAGVAVAADARMLRFVPAPGGAARAAARSMQERRTLLQVCAAGSLMGTLAVVVLGAVQLRRERQARH